MLRVDFAILWLFSIGCFAPAAFADDNGKSASATETINILSYNIHMWQIKVDDLATVITESKADVVGLNEAWDKTRNDRLAKKLGYNIVYGGQKSSENEPPKPHTVNGYYMPQVLLTKHKIVWSRLFNAVAAKGHESYDADVPIYRGGTMALLETAKGTRFIVFVLHLHPWGDGNNEKMTTMREKEIAGILKKLKEFKDMPKIIMGDFNTRSHLDENGGWKVSRVLKKAGYADLYRTINPNLKEKPGLTCGDGRIDYIFYNKPFSPKTCKVVKDGVFQSRGYKQSDHLAVSGTLQIPTKTDRRAQ